VGLSLAAAEAAGYPVGFDVLVGALYEKDTAQTYLDIMSQ
jgi:simple sugar transport system substrate-binding protein